MKQYTTPEQTAKLIELGFEKPKSERWVLDVANESTPSIQNIVKRQDYSIGELIEQLPPSLKFSDGDSPLTIESDPFLTNFTWWVYYAFSCQTKAPELIDALYEMVVKLKEECVI